MKNRKNHHLLSTAVCPGIYNSTPNKPNLHDVEDAIRGTQPFSKEERLTMKQKKIEEHLKTSIGIPRDNDEYDNDESRKPSQPLPPLRNKPQVQRISITKIISLYQTIYFVFPIPSPSLFIQQTNDYIQQANDYMQQTNDYMQQTNDYMQQTNDYMQQTNDYYM